MEALKVSKNPVFSEMSFYVKCWFQDKIIKKFPVTVPQT